MLQPRGGAGLVAHADKLFVIEGSTGKEEGDVHMFDLTQQKWQEVTGGMPLPARSVFACGLVPQVCNECGTESSDKTSQWIMVFGGEVDPSDLGHEGAGDYVDEAFALYPAKPHLGWHKMQVQGAAPPPRAWLASTWCDGGVALHGGNAPDNNRLSDLFFLQH